MGKMKNGVKKVGERYQASVNLGKRPRQRCRDCNAAYWIERRPLKACKKCGGQLYEKWEPRTDYLGTFDDPKDAIAAHDAAKVRVTQGTYVNPGKLTVAEYLREWVKSLPKAEEDPDDGLAPATLASYEMLIERHVVPRLGGLKLKDLTGQRLAEHRAYLAREGRMDGGSLKPATVNKTKAVVHAALADAVGYGLLPHNPADAMGRRKRSRGRRERQRIAAWNREELTAFLNACRGDRLYTLWLTVVNTGIRRSEALGLKWSDVDFDEGTVKIERARVPVKGEVHEGPPKTGGSNRVVEPDKWVLTVLRQWETRQKEERLKAGSAWHDTGYVFTYEDGRPLDPRWVSRLFVRAIDAANAEAKKAAENNGGKPFLLSHLSIHGLRHTYATIAIAAGVPLERVSKNLGHANIQITANVYVHYIEEMREKDAERIGAHMLAAHAQPTI